MRELKNNGFVVDKYNFYIKNLVVVCDAPARAFISGSRSHNYTYGCNKCLVKGRSINNKMCFLQTEKLKSRESYSDFTEYFIVKSPLLEFDINLISDVLLDPMHLVFLGVVKKLLTFLVHGNTNQRLSQERIAKIYKNL